jgi:glycosyltransferase involved in cell wall biosynthesis
VIEHGVKPLAEARWHGGLERGLVVVNNLERRWGGQGEDVLGPAERELPLGLAGMNSEAVGARLCLGEVAHAQLPGTMAAHRFLFNPIRYTSLGLAVVEAMMIGLPIVGLATTELSSVIRNGEHGWIDTRLDRLVDAMRRLLADRGLAAEWGAAARRAALERFGIERFVADWCGALREVAG